jgi:hypothetical protein
MSDQFLENPGRVSPLKKLVVGLKKGLRLTFKGTQAFVQGSRIIETSSGT